MTFELAISTMHKTEEEILLMLHEMNVDCDCIVINQCDEEKEIEISYKNNKITVIFTLERGLSRSRNMAISKSNAEIIAIADDDLFYYDNFQKTVCNFYENHPTADIVVFNMDNYERKYPEKTYKCKFYELSSFTSMQITLKREKVKSKFNELFGTGSKIFDSGEENIFLADCYRNHNSVYYCHKKILLREQKQSSWFKGYNDEKFLSDRGAVYYAISKFLFPLYVLRFAFLKRSLVRPKTSFEVIKLMLLGKKEYKKYVDGKQ